MPTPHKGEKEADFMKRCIPMVIREKTAKDEKQAVAVCLSLWRRGKSKEEYEKDEANQPTS